MYALITRYKAAIKMSTGLLLAGLIFSAAWFWQANAYGMVIATNEANRQADLALIANAGATQARQALAKQHKMPSRSLQPWINPLKSFSVDFLVDMPDTFPLGEACDRF